jgi:hypothetical protein
MRRSVFCVRAANDAPRARLFKNQCGCAAGSAGAPAAANGEAPQDFRNNARLEDDLREVLAAEARRQMRSLCSEIKFRLRQTLERHQDVATA